MTEDQLPILQRLTPAQVLIALDQGTKVFGRLPFYEGDKAHFFRIDECDYPHFKSLLEADPDKEDAETFFYLDFDRDLILDPTAEL